jgi:hypothetical protein
VSVARLRASDLTAPYHGVRVARAPVGIVQLARAYSPRLLPGQYFSHTTAAVLLGLRMPEGFVETAVHVTSPAPLRAPRGKGVVGHQSTRNPPIREANGLVVSSPIDTWTSLAAVLGREDLIAMGDGLVCRKRPAATLTQLRSAVSAFEGRGALALRHCIEQVRPGTDSHRETQLRRLVIRWGFPEPEVNGVIRNSFGAVIAHGDLVFRAYRTILEYDGGHHRESDRQFAIDIDRLDSIMEQRWRVIRVNKSLMARRATLVGKLDTALRQAGWSPASGAN